MAFRALGTGEKLIALGVGAGAVYWYAATEQIPYWVDAVKVFKKQAFIPIYKRELILEEWKKLQDSSSSETLLKKYLTKPMVNDLKSRKTRYHTTLLQVMAEAINYPKGEVGVVAPDPAVYDIYGALFDPIVAELHGFSLKTLKTQPATDWGERKLDYFQPLPAEYVKNVKLECCKTLKYFLFNPASSETEQFHFEKMVSMAFRDMNRKHQDDSDVAGSAVWFRKAKDDHDVKNLPGFFKNDDQRLKAVGAYNVWPIGRGVYVNNSRNLFVKLNEDEHLKFVTLAERGNLKDAMSRMAKITTALGEDIPYDSHDRFGQTAFSPKNVGSGLTVACDLKLPKLSKRDDFKETLASLKLAQIKRDSDVVQISNAHKLGMTEFETAKLVYDGVRKLVDLEKQL